MIPLAVYAVTVLLFAALLDHQRRQIADVASAIKRLESRVGLVQMRLEEVESRLKPNGHVLSAMAETKQAAEG